MKKIIFCLFFGVIIFIACHSQSYANNILQEKLLNLAKEQVNHLTIKNYSEILKSFNEILAKELDNMELEQAWKQITNNLGKKLNQQIIYGEQNQNYYTVNILEKYEKGEIKIIISYDNNEKIAGIYFKPITILIK